jgi:anaerobic magnesium-protoporphyrin IX monomethyl ester cyclase
MDVLLIHPPYGSLRGIPADCAYSVGLTSLAAYLRQAGVECGVIMGDVLMDLPSVFDTWSADQGEDHVVSSARAYRDGQRDYENALSDKDHPVWKRLADLVRRSRPKLVGISYLTPIKYPFEMVANIVKEIDPEIRIVAGGAHTTFCPDDVMQNPHVDFAIGGEGEIPLLALSRELNKEIPDWRAVPGMTYRDPDGRLRHNPRAPLIEDLDRLPFPARDLVLDCDYQVYPVHCTSTTRGCPYTCSFCADRNIWGGRVRRRSVDNVIAELQHLKSAYAIKSIDFVDGTFTYDRNYLRSFCNALNDHDLGIHWRCCARYDNLDGELLAVMSRSGCAGMFFGLESGSDRVLKAIDKKTSVDQIVRVSEMVADSGIPSITSVMMGLPGETRDDLAQTVSLMRRIKTDFFEVNSFTPMPGSRLYDPQDPRQSGIDWLRVSFKSYDTCFSNTISPEHLKACLSEARDIADGVLKATVSRFSAAHVASP